ncbi:protein FAM91A1 isoform X2 [Phalaenopsis equestris]|uniref:protein FAM91A1 isoform X2 n=1 Tax=Phalaenopsis equestris TaxID=78828 RepID=UPI0009E41CDA|nr:protein FAM91A1 isoform X2 [Phalaenopsis equestris]
MLMGKPPKEAPGDYLHERGVAQECRIIEHCIKKRLQWHTSFARKVCKEAEYYEEMMRYLRKNLALFPYHLADYVCRVMRISPFKYYCDMIFEVMKNEQPYDSIPNFSAADALRLTGVGRNEFIDIMNKCRSKKIMWKLNKSIAKELLPTQPVDFAVEPWWEVCLVNFTLEEFKKLTEEEMATIDKVCKEEANSFMLFDSSIVNGLYRRGLVYFDVPVHSDDRFKVSRLEGFVSNKEQSYEDPIEELLYAVFVVSSENATVAELASTLQADLFQLQAAASFASRLGWAVKIIDPEAVLRSSSVDISSSTLLSDDEDVSMASISSETVGVHGIGIEQNRPLSDTARVALVVDANITSYLMMGSISPGLKSHAVTLYEAGKLGDTVIADLCKDLSTLEGKKFEGELQEFANHAFSLRCFLECLQSGGISSDEIFDMASHQVNVQLTNSGISPSSSDVDPINECGGLKQHDDETLRFDYNQNSNVDSGLHESQFPSVKPEALSKASSEIDNSKENNDLENDSRVLRDGSKMELMIKRKYRVDILRCESLASLAPATLERLFLRDYDIIVSMVPLPSSSILPGASGPIHFGPPSYSSMTPWMKLVLYTMMGSGPVSVVLMKGQSLRMLPAPLVGCKKALIWSWDGSTIGGLGGKFEGNLVNGNILLHCLNSIIKYSAVLVQPLNTLDLDESGRIITVDIALPLKNLDGSVTHVEDMGLDLEENESLNYLLDELSGKFGSWTIGYIRLLRLQKEKKPDSFIADKEKFKWVPLSMEFGIPLFSPKLCSRICDRLVSSCLLQSNSLYEHHEAMQDLRKKLREICSEYHATGPTAKLFYQTDRTKESPHHLINYASGRWSPLLDPSTPISGAASEHQRLKIANRHRCRTEVLSFDGNILRSYALAPVYEAATRPIDDSALMTTGKLESDDAESKEIVLPAVNLLFDGSQLVPFDIGACLQARQPISLIAEAAAASVSLQLNRAL